MTSSSVPDTTTSPPARPAPGPRSTDVVRRADRVLVVLDDEHSVPQVPKRFERAEQPFVVALVKADRWLVQNVEHTDQLAPDLSGQADPPGPPLRKDSPRTDPASGNPTPTLARKPRRSPTSLRMGPAICADSGLTPGWARPSPSTGSDEKKATASSTDIPMMSEMARPAHDHRERLGPESASRAGRAGQRRHVLFELPADGLGLGFPVSPLHPGDDSLPELLVVTGRPRRSGMGNGSACCPIRRGWPHARPREAPPTGCSGRTRRPRPTQGSPNA